MTAYVDLDDLAAFVASVHGRPPEAFAAALIEAARRNGALIAPDGCGARPASHLHEISAFGAYGEGASQAEAVASWRRAAANLLKGDTP